MHAYLIVGANDQDLKVKINELTTKLGAVKMLFRLQKIEDARELKNLVKFSFSEKTALILENIDSSTVECLNAFLKNLEEPNKNIIYVLTARNLGNVLPTIVSRCQIIRINGQKLTVNDKAIKEFLSQSINKKIEIIGKIKDRTEAIDFVEDLIILEKENNNYLNMQNFLETLKNLKLNGNVSLQLTNLIVRMNSHG